MKKIMDTLSENNIFSLQFISVILGILFILGYFFWDNNFLLIILFLFFEGINLLRLKFSREILMILNKIIDYRFTFAILLFLVCIIFKLHGSSIGIYNDLILENRNSTEISEIIGEPRQIRSDEWRAHTPYYFSQFYNNYDLKSYQMSISGQDMTIAYNAPVNNITEIAKPQSWGYILFGNEVGLSWYWCFQLILLCLGSFELAMIVTKNNRLLSFLGLMLIGFSPLLHWWFIPHITIVFVWGILLTVLGYYFFTTRSEKNRGLISIAIVISLCAFVFALFPSCQIPVALISLVLLITLLIRDQGKITFRRQNIFHLLFILIFIFVVLGYFIYTSREGLSAVLNTVYPGERIWTGKDSRLRDLFSDLTVIFLPYKDITYLNNCEVSEFIHVGPLFFILYPVIYRKINKKDRIVGNAIFVMLLVQIVFMCFGFSEMFAKITLFSHINRMSISYGYLSTIFTIWGIYIFSENEKLINEKITMLIAAMYGLIYLTFLTNELLEYMPLYMFVIEIAAYVLLVYLILNKQMKLTVIIFTSMILMATTTINPITTGISAITDHKLYDEIEKIVESDDSNWIVLNDVSMSAYLLASGAKVINGVNYYPDYGKWDRIDASRENENIYNRYAHIDMLLAEEKDYKVLTADSILLNIRLEDLVKWDVKYIFSTGSIEEYLENTEYELIYEDHINTYYIYKIEN